MKFYQKSISRLKKFEDVFIVSNGSLLDEKRAIKLLDTNITKIQFSLDAFKTEWYMQSPSPGEYLIL